MLLRKCQNYEAENNLMRYVWYNYEVTDTKRKALQLHKQFAHISDEKLIRLVKEAGIRDVKLEEEIIKVGVTCETYIKCKKALSRPIVSMPLAKNFDEVVSMDLKV